MKENHMASELLLDLANKISRTKRGSKLEIKADHPEYLIMEPVITDEMAEVALCLELRQPMTAEEVAPLCGKSIEKTAELLWNIADAGMAFVNEIDGVDKYWTEIWVPGHMEMMVNHKENVKKYPQIARAFDAYGLKKGPMAVGKFPVGLGPMRVIPIEKAIDGNTRTASFEEVSKYLDENTIFSLSDCACRTSREAMGEGCGHLKEDICIQMGHAAEYYIRTGRAKEISREEAIEVIKKAEENGLMHSIPNLDGPGKTHAICNCCGCGCFNMRLASHWSNPDMARSNYVSEVDTEKCVACGECVENCPTNALTLGQKICTEVIAAPKKQEKFHNTDWGADKWNPDYRTNRKVVSDEGSSPCKAECPAHIGIQGYIKLASTGRYKEALELIKEENPFPAVCGRICPRKCESACTRGDIDDPLAIDDIKKFIADKELSGDSRFIPRIKNDYGKKIAVVGAGPAGLSCAFYMAIDGYKVTVFEKQKALGGMMTLGIPSFRLEKDVVNAEINILKDLGVEFKTNVEIGSDISLKELRSQGYEAFFLAIGAQAGRRLGIEGEDANGVISGVDFLCNVNLGESKELKGKTIVIGGGNVAIDVARTAVRVGSDKVEMFCLENRKQMPALDEEIEEALAEDIEIKNSWGPVKVLTEKGKVKAVEFRKCLSVFDENGRFSPSYDDNDIMTVEADNVLISVGQSIEWGEILKDSKVELNPNKTIKADPKTLQTAEEDIFTGGDALTGPRFAIDAIAFGKEAAISIHRHVQPGQDLLIGRTIRDYRSFDKDSLNLDGYDKIPRETTAHVAAKESKETFNDLRGTFTEDQIKKETERCLGCGATVVDEFMCVGCGVCTTKCKFDAISLIKKYDKEGVDLDDLKPEVIKYVIKRQMKIAVNKPIKAISKAFSRV
jgi:NADPH-dependent glutamate synthase beta subunit-like oxidoreductase/NAD-dependent dihydropyrimidine dehydrogenase PreA subunit